jgi:hypothetical protein
MDTIGLDGRMPHIEGASGTEYSRKQDKQIRLPEVRFL